MPQTLKSNTDWKHWGDSDPLWGVASWADRQKTGARPWTDEEFYALGESDWNDFRAQWKSYGLDELMCVEIGCGAGRITRQLGKDFKSVCALDVSESMMLKARGACENNVSFCLVEGVKIPLDDDSATAVFSTHVLQHLDSVELGYQYFSEAYRVLRPGATLMIHLPLYQWPNDTGRMGTVWRSLYKWFRRVDDFRADFNRGRGVPIMRGTPYPIMPLTSTLIAIGFHDVQIRIFPTSANEHMHPFVFARK